MYCRPGHNKAGTVHIKQVYEIAKIKVTDEHLKHNSVEAFCRSVMGTAKSMGIEVVSD